MPFGAKGLLDQLLSSGQDVLRQQQRGQERPKSSGRTGGSSGDLSQLLGGLAGRGGGGALGGGALGLLLGSKRLRRKRGGLASTGGAALLGALAYKAYTEWQAQKQQGAAGAPRTLDRVEGAEAEAQSSAVLVALVGAAKADGHVDDREREAIEAEFRRLNESAEVQGWLDEQLRKPLDPKEVAAAADGPVTASEMYLASRLVIDTENFMERAYLDELARQLHLDGDLQARLDQQAEQALSGQA